MLALEDAKNLTLRQIIGRLSREFEMYNIAETAIQQSREKEASDIELCVRYLNQEFGETLMQYWQRIKENVKILSWQGKVAVLAATRIKSIRKHVKLEYIRKESDITEIIYLCDEERETQLIRKNNCEFQREKKIRKENKISAVNRKEEEQKTNEDVKNLQIRVKEIDEDIKNLNKRNGENLIKIHEQKM